MRIIHKQVHHNKNPVAVGNLDIQLQFHAVVLQLIRFDVNGLNANAATAPVLLKTAAAGHITVPNAS